MVKETRDGTFASDATGGTDRTALYVYPGDFERRGLVSNLSNGTWDASAGLGTESQYMVAGARVVWKDATHGGMGFEPDIRVTYALPNLIQSTTGVVDLISGELLERTTFYPNGARETLRTNTASAGAWGTEPVGFTGKEGDDEVGLTYFGERYLLQHLGRWASPDPLQVHAGGGGEFGNSYHYVSGNLLQARDPVGLDVTYDEIDGQWFRVEDTDANTLTYTAVDYPRADAFATGVAEGVNQVAEGVADGIVERLTDTRRPGSMDNPDLGLIWDDTVAIVESIGAAGVAIAEGLGALYDLVSGDSDDPNEIHQDATKTTVGTVVVGGAVAGGSTLGRRVRSRTRSPSQPHADVSPSSARVRGCPTCPCFVAGTLVLMADGTARPIEHLAAGEWVFADDPTDHERSTARRVTETHRSRSRRLVSILVAGATIEATGEHPFWVAGHGWVAADNLLAGDLLLDQRGEFVSVTAVAEMSREVETFNLTVEGLSTYFVVVNQRAVLVHNQSTAYRRNRGGYWNYVLKDAQGVYYVGRAGPGQTEQDVMRRHRSTGRYDPSRGDIFERVPGTRRYRASRVMEHEMIIEHMTFQGRPASAHAQNADNGISRSKARLYYDDLSDYRYFDPATGELRSICP